MLAGTKRATASLVLTHEHDGKKPPRVGSLSIMTDWHGAVLGIIETLSIEAVPFEEVTAEFAAIEGEGDKSLRYWREEHWAYFKGECERIGREPSLRMPVYCERFELVFAGPTPARLASS